MQELQRRRIEMVEMQIASRGVRDARVLAAMREVPREEFVNADLREFAYRDAPLPIEEGQTISQPFVVALMIEAARITPNDRVLEVGAGSGYASAVLGRIAREVFAVERHHVLADLARERMRRLGYRNVRVEEGDGTRGLAAQAPFDAILVSAGGPEVPQALLDQLAPGGRLLIPVGREPRGQELLRVTRIGEGKFERESLGSVSFVPLIGSEGWAADGSPIAPSRAPRPLRIRASQRERLAALVRTSCEPIEDLERSSLAPLVARLAEARVVLIGEATHGTSEFHRLRARITRELVAHHGFLAVALEGDFADVAVLDRRVRGMPLRETREPPFARFPQWMWRNEETREFLRWLEEHDRGVEERGRRASLHGLDLYGLNNSIGAVLDYLDRVDPVAAASARIRYGCFTPWEMDPAIYGRAVSGGRLEGCEDQAVAMLRDLLARRRDYASLDGDAYFEAVRHAEVVRGAEAYYRAMYRGAAESWNLRDRHMFSTLESVMLHRGPQARAVVWAHNSHVGDASATEMAGRGELNLGQLARKRWGSACRLVGFGTHRGRVAAAANWGDPMEIMRVRDSHEDSYERICHESGVGAFVLPLRAPHDAAVRVELRTPRLQRAIGVIYRPETEMLSHYYQASLSEQFDEYVWIDETEAVRAIPTRGVEGDPDTYPFGL